MSVSVEFNNGLKAPILGLGTWKSTVRKVVKTLLLVYTGLVVVGGGGLTPVPDVSCPLKTWFFFIKDGGYM